MDIMTESLADSGVKTVTEKLPFIETRLPGKIIKSFKCTSFMAGADGRGRSKKGYKYEFRLELAKCFTDKNSDEIYGLEIEDVTIYYIDEFDKWGKQSLVNVANNLWAWDSDFNQTFKREVLNLKPRSTFIAIRLKSSLEHLSRYNFDTPWTFELKIKHTTSGGWIRDKKEQYELIRHSDWKEVPSFKIRRKYPDYG
jgi:hypothetical protein